MMKNTIIIRSALILMLLPSIVTAQRSQPISKVGQYKNLILSNKDPQFVNVFLNTINTRGGASWVNDKPEQLFGSIIAEANFSPMVFLYNGRDHWGKTFWNRFILSFDAILSLRMYRTRKDNPFTISSPVRPLNFNPGMSLFYLINNNIDKGNSLYFQFEADHLSNGQQNSHFEKLDEVNFISGDFSTNFLRFSISDNRYLGKKGSYLLSNTIGFRFEGEWEGTPFSIVPEQRNRIGDKRFSFISQLRINNVEAFKRKDKINVKGITAERKLLDSNEYIYVIQKTKTISDSKSEISRKHNFLLRTKLEYQLGNLEKYTYYGDDKHRTSVDIYFSYHQSHWNDFRIYGAFYAGRDYLNIRYTDIIKYFHVGLEIPLQRYKPIKELNDDISPFQSDEIYSIRKGGIYRFISDQQIFYFNNQAYKFNMFNLKDVQFLNSEYYPCQIKNGEIILDDAQFKKLFTKI